MFYHSQNECKDLHISQKVLCVIISQQYLKQRAVMTHKEYLNK